ncbi:MAG: hypothetical protein NTV68_06295 [Methanomicrobiales archaeon]|nr:hypothetical protein [Methanomicrobiales archaeon]
MVQEYKRTCYSCETVWHSLKSREETVKSGASAGAGRLGQPEGSARSCSYCGMCGGTVITMGNRGGNDMKAELDRLRTCPHCGSHNYFEEVREQEVLEYVET